MDRKRRRSPGTRPAHAGQLPVLPEEACGQDDPDDFLSNEEWFELFGHLVDESAEQPCALRSYPAVRFRDTAGSRPTLRDRSSTSWLVRAIHELDSAMHRSSEAWTDDAATLAHLQQTERLIAGLHALQTRLLVDLAGGTVRTEQHGTGDGSTVTICDSVRSEIAAALRWTEAQAYDRITVARLLDRVLPLTRKALASGMITYRHAEAVADVVGRHSDAIAVLDGTAGIAATAEFADDAAFIEHRAVGAARRAGVSAARQAADRALRRRDADHVRIRRQRALRRRDVWMEVEPDGTALLLARMGIGQAHACLGAIDTLARDPRLPLSSDSAADAGIGERRSEALIYRVIGQLPSIDSSSPPVDDSSSPPVDDSSSPPVDDSSSPPVDDGSRTAAVVHLDVTVDLTTLLGLAEGPVTVRGRGPAGASWTDVAEIRKLLVDAGSVTLRRLVTDPLTGHLLDRGRRTYRVTDALRHFLVARDRTCRFPGCSRAAHLSQMDHASPWESGGTTDRSNLGALCTRHHQLKTHSGWRIITSDLSGSCTWQSPLGLEYRHAPPSWSDPPPVVERASTPEFPVGGRDGPIPF
jgi:hypothetical protein